MALVVAQTDAMDDPKLDLKGASCEGMASEEDVRCRAAAAESDICCFITFMGLDDQDEAVLGLGLRRHPKSARQNSLGIPGDVDLVFDYIEVEAFNTGLERAMEVGGGVPRPPFIVSSGRRQLNAWLPLYFNAQHWSRAKPYAMSAFRVLSGRNPGAPVRPRDILNVCCGLLNSAAVGFTKGETALSTPRTAERGKASEKGMQMYADIHRLLLQMACEYPAVRRLAKKRLQDFILDPASRTRARTPCLGSLIHCLLVVEDVTWEDLAFTLIPEAFRRHVIRQESKGYHFDSRWCAASADQLISLFDWFAPRAGMVVTFFVMFYHRVGRPKGDSLEEVQCRYDRRWGRLPDNANTELVEMCNHLRQKASAADFFPLMFPWTSGGPQSLKEVVQWAETHSRASISSSLCEMILWAEKYGHSHTLIPERNWPVLNGPHDLLDEWWEACQRRACWRRIQPAQPLQQRPPKDISWDGGQWCQWHQPSAPDSQGNWQYPHHWQHAQMQPFPDSYAVMLGYSNNGHQYFVIPSF